MTDRLSVRPITLRAANAFVAEKHRHHRPDRGCCFCIAAILGGAVVGVVIVGRPKSRNLDDGTTAEVTRLCTDGSRNACSLLYGASARAARAIGYHRITTVTLPDEGGASLRASNWTADAKPCGGGSWSRESREREDKHPLEEKTRWWLRLCDVKCECEKGRTT